MKFVSKSANLRVVLKPGQPPEQATGRLAIPGMYVKFENGFANVNDETIAKMMLQHPAFNVDFITADELPSDPYSSSRKQAEPVHVITEMEHGHPGKKITSAVTPQIPPEQKELLKKVAMEMAMELAKQMAPEMAKEILRKAVAEKGVEKVLTKGKPGRPPKKKVNEPVEQDNAPIEKNNEQESNV